jgi:succinyl-diaminopimelate desuccinylase
VDEVFPNRFNVIIQWTFGSGPKTLLFEGHTDVVTPGDVSKWTYDPFGAKIVGDRMYGRGTCDTKGNLAAMLIAMSALKQSGFNLNGSIIGGALCDEEGQMIGVQNFIQRGYADSITGAIICEPQDGRICTSQKGAIRARYSISGKMSHGAMPLSGLSTAPAVATLIENLLQFDTDEINTMGKDDLLGWPSVTPTVIQAPSTGTPQLNVLPGTADILVDIRTIPAQNHQDMINRLMRIATNVQIQVKQHYQEYDQRLDIPTRQDVKVDMDILTDRPCTQTDPHDPVVRATHWATRLVTENEPRYDGVPGSTDGTYLWALKNIPIVTIGAGDRQVPHQVDEWVDLNQLYQTAQIYALTGLKYLTEPESS